MEKTKLYILSGFLGSGKTTVLLKLLENTPDKKIGIIQNDLGKVCVDGTVLKRDGIEMIELTRGSIFCTCLQLQFVQALADMSEKHMDYVIVESSGFGDPSNVEQILAAARELAGDVYDFQGVVSLVDAFNFLENINEMETVTRQLKHCHLAILTKTDLVDAETIQKIKEKIREINPVCPIGCSDHGNIDVEFLGENLMKYKWAEGEETTNSEETKPKTICLEFDGVVEKEKLEQFIEAVYHETYRMKGFFNLKEEGWQKVDVVGKQVVYEPYAPQELSQLVIISKVGNAVIRTAHDAWGKYVGLAMKLKN